MTEIDLTIKMAQDKTTLIKVKQSLPGRFSQVNINKTHNESYIIYTCYKLVNPLLYLIK